MRIEELVKEARRCLKIHKDDGYFLKFQDFIDLVEYAIEKGGKFRLNQPQISGTYCHEIFYDGIRFISVTEKKIKKINF